MKSKIFKISVVILLIMTLTMTNFIFLGSSHSAVNGWGTQTKPFPKYIKPLLESLAKVRELEHTIQDLQAQIKKDSKH